MSKLRNISNNFFVIPTTNKKYKKIPTPQIKYDKINLYINLKKKIIIIFL